MYTGQQQKAVLIDTILASGHKGVLWNTFKKTNVQ